MRKANLENHDKFAKKAEETKNMKAWERKDFSLHLGAQIKTEASMEPKHRHH